LRGEDLGINFLTVVEVSYESIVVGMVFVACVNSGLQAGNKEAKNSEGPDGK
jgi:hypothetical protein